MSLGYNTSVRHCNVLWIVASPNKLALSNAEDNGPILEYLDEYRILLLNTYNPKAGAGESVGELASIKCILAPAPMVQLPLLTP